MRSHDQWKMSIRDEREINKSLVKQLLRSIASKIESSETVCLGIDIINERQDLFDREELYHETRRTGEQRVIIDLYNDEVSEFE